MRIFKKIVVLILALFASIALVGCNYATKVQEAVNSIALGNTYSLTQSFNLIKETGKHKLPITWSIENVEEETCTLDLTGKLPRVIVTPTPYSEDENGNQTNSWGHAILTATVKLGNKSASRNWDLWVKPEGRIFTLDIGEAATREAGTPVRITGTVSYMHGAGYYVEDETGSIYVYGKPSNNQLPENLKPGAKVKIEGLITVYYNQPEISSGYKVEVLEEAPATGYDYASVAQDAFIPEIVWTNSTDTTAYGKIINVVGKVTKSKYGNNENYEIADEETNTKVMIYYDSEKGFMDAIEANLGKTVKATVITYNYQSKDKVWRVFGYAGSVEEATAKTYTDADKVYLINVILKNKYNGISVSSDLTLDTTVAAFEGATITWESKNTSVIGNDGKFTSPTEETEVELEATVKVGDTEQKYTYKVTAIAPTKLTVAELLEAIDDDTAKAVLVEGVIIGRDSSGYFYLADETGVVYTRVKLSDKGVAVGDKVRIIANGGVYDGTNRYNKQFAKDGNAVVVKVDNEKHDSPLEPVEASISDFDHTITKETLAKVKEEELFGKVFEISGYFVLVQSGEYMDLYLAESLDEGADKVRIYHSSMEVDALKMLVGKQVTITAVVYECNPSSGVWNLGFLGREGDLEVTLTDADKEGIAQKEIEAILPEDNILTRDLKFFNNTKYSYVLGNVSYAFLSSQTNVLGNDGKYTAPAEDTTVTLTVTATFSQEHSKVYTYTLTAKAPEENPVINSTIIISQAYGGGGNSGATYKNDFIELYNTTDQDINLTGYVLFYASATNNFSNDDQYKVVLSGTIKAKSFYLIQAAAGNGGTADLPTPDATCTISMGSSGFKLALCNSSDVPTDSNSANVVDFVGCGNDVNDFETSKAPTPSNTLAIVRQQLRDTNNNGADFVTAEPNPRNSAYVAH